jgi:hypothetical protein
MNYELIYKKIIKRGKERILEGYKESHHIIPRCMGGSDDSSNLVKLTPEAHYVAHQLLVKIYPGNHKLIFAANMMKVDQSNRRANNKIYGWIRRKVILALSESAKKTNKGRLVSAETRAKISLALKNKVVSEETRAKLRVARSKLTDETRAKIGSVHKNKIVTAETRAKIGYASSNRSAETRAKLSAANQRLPTVVCPHCNKLGKINGMNRYHFDNCNKNLWYCTDGIRCSELIWIKRPSPRPLSPSSPTPTFESDLAFIN